ncbi:MAG: 2-oxoacid:acceptor oxidoreductase family protein, partial [Anaerolineae bacterium]|nr:2-oxoacid:acceptor oxidoreductase family protein [Anaerolineae bacterium]
YLRFGPNPIRSNYLISKANFTACHQFSFLERHDVLREVIPGGVFLLNSPYGPDEVWQHLPRRVQEDIIQKHLKFYVIDGYRIARESGMPGRINTVMQVCFFAISGVLPPDEAIAAIKTSIEKTYGKKGEAIVEVNLKAVDRTLENLFEVQVPSQVDSQFELLPPVTAAAPDFVRGVLGEMIAGRGDLLPVSMIPADGTYPT